MNRLIARLVDFSNRTLVLAYKALGLVVLLTLLVALGSFISLHGYFILSRSWLAPSVLVAQSEVVVARYAMVERERNAAAHLEVSLQDLKSEHEMEQLKIAAYTKLLIDASQGLTRGAAMTRAEADRIRKLARRLTKDFEKSRTMDSDVEKQSDDRITALKEARLLDPLVALQAQDRRADRIRTEAAAVETTTMLEVEAQRLSIDAQAHQQALLLDSPRGESTPSKTILTSDALRIAAELQQWRQELEFAKLRSTVLTKEQQLVAAAKARQDELVAQLVATPYYRALQHRVHVAFVPYENLRFVQTGETIEACALALFWCRDVGKVLEPASGEVQVQHPFRSEQVRGMFMELSLSDDEAARDWLLFSKKGWIELIRNWSSELFA